MQQQHDQYIHTLILFFSHSTGILGTVCPRACMSFSVIDTYTEYQNVHSTTNVRTFLESEDISAGPHSLKVLFGG